jgi:hypothetical protein
MLRAEPASADFASSEIAHRAAHPVCAIEARVSVLHRVGVRSLQLRRTVDPSRSKIKHRYRLLDDSYMYSRRSSTHTLFARHTVAVQSPDFPSVCAPPFLTVARDTVRSILQRDGTKPIDRIECMNIHYIL